MMGISFITVTRVRGLEPTRKRKTPSTNLVRGGGELDAALGNPEAPEWLWVAWASSERLLICSCDTCETAITSIFEQYASFATTATTSFSKTRIVASASRTLSSFSESQTGYFGVATCGVSTVRDRFCKRLSNVIMVWKARIFLGVSWSPASLDVRGALNGLSESSSNSDVSKSLDLGNTKEGPALGSWAGEILGTSTASSDEILDSLLRLELPFLTIERMNLNDGMAAVGAAVTDSSEGRVKTCERPSPTCFLARDLFR